MREMMKILMYDEKTDAIKSEKYKKDGPVAMNDVLAIRSACVSAIIHQ